MATVEQTTQEALPLTPAMQKLARRETRGRFIGLAISLAVGLIGFALYFALLLTNGLSAPGADGVLLILFSVAGWAAIVALLGWSAISARHLARDGTYNRYVGPFSIWHGDAQDDSTHIALYLDGVRVLLGREAQLPSGIVDLIAVSGGGVVDWLYGVGVLTIRDERGKCIYRMRHYEADPAVPPPPVRHAKRRA